MKNKEFEYGYCLNPHCSQPQNLPHLHQCNACQFPLIYEAKSGTYRAIKSLDKQREGRVREVYDTCSYEGINEQGSRYILKVFNSSVSTVHKLFKKEKEILSTLNHPRIPELIEDFSVQIDGVFFQVLVTQKIESENLQYWLNNNKLSQKQGIEWMKQMIEIVDYVHRNGFLHQDIKPSNVLVNHQENKLYLIDFSNIPDVISPGYTAPEQADGDEVAASDFFALGRTFIHLFTGRHPLDLRDPQTGKLNWRPSALHLSEEFADLIDQLIETNPEKRLSNPFTIYQKLEKIEQSNQGKNNHKVLKIVSVLGLIFITFFLGFYSGNSYQRNQNSSFFTTLQKCIDFNFLDRLNNAKYERRSLGEKMLVPRLENSNRKEKLNEIQTVIKNCNLDDAIAKFKVLQENDLRPDAEIQIYLNNLEALKSPKPLIQIVVSLPFDKSPSDLEVLRGVAMAQSFNNNDKDNNLLLIEIAKDDRKNKNIVRFLANEFVNDSRIKAVIGHRSSNASLWAADIYQSKKLVMISPSSSSPRVALKGDYIFQSVFNNDLLASALVNHIDNTTSIQKILICHTEYSDYSISFADSIINNFNELEKGIEIINKPCFKDLIDYTYERQLNSILSTIQEEQIQGLILIPSTTPERLKQANQLVEKITNNDLSISIFGGDTLYGGETFETFKTSENFPNMVLTVPSHPDINTEWVQQAKQMWKGNVTWRTMTAFDSTQAIIEGFKNSPSLSRQDLQKNLSNPNFQFNGATGNFTFSETGARQGGGCIVKLSDSNLKNKGTPFQLIECDNSPSE